MRTGASGTTYAAAIIAAITSAAAASGFDNVVISTPAEVAATITVPDTVTITLPPAPTPTPPPSPPAPTPTPPPPSAPVDPGDAAECPAGYAFDGPAFFDISTTGTQITAWGQNPDDGFFEVPLGFTMPWYGNVEDIIHVGTNGYITFGSAHFPFGTSEPFPGDPTGPVDGVIGVYWADINPDPAVNVAGAGVFYQAFGTDSMVVQWHNVVYWTGNNDPTTNTFQATLFPSGGVILAYGAMNDATGTLSWSTESIGYESQDGLEGVQISYDVVPDSNTAYYIPPVCTFRTEPPAPPPEYIDVTFMAASVGGMTTVRLTVSLDGSMSNVYAMAGTQDQIMSFPAAFQVAAPFGTDIGGVSPAFFPVNADAEFDSWLTIGITDGSTPGAISASPGLGLGAWSATAGISEDNGAVFYMSPDDGPGGADIVLAQITSATPSGTASAQLQGRSVAGADWTMVKEWTW